MRITDFYSNRQVGQESRVSMMVAFQDGTAVTVALRSIEALTELSGVLERWLPHATHGYSSELDAQFAANPASLRRAG